MPSPRGRRISANATVSLETKDAQDDSYTSLAQIDNCPPAADKGVHNGEVKLESPDGAELRIYLAGSAYVWQLYNGSPRPIPQVQLEIDSIRTFDANKSEFREPVNFTFRWPIFRNLGAGYLTGPEIFLRAERDHLEYWNTHGNILPWPDGDQSLRRCWRLTMNVTGLSMEWPIDVYVTWTVGKKQ